MNLGAIFLTGLLTGGLTCLAVQGGLLATSIAQRPNFAKASSGKEEEMKIMLQKGNAMTILAFLVAKLVAYTILGFLLGWFGSLFQLSLTAQVVMQLAVVIFMIGTALNLLNVHPIFRYFAIQPPKRIMRLVKNQSKSKHLFAPILLGAFTVFIPCGTTQAMMALAIGSGNPFMGALILFAFVLGTSPLFFILGYFATRLGETMHKQFLKVAAIALILLALFNLKGVYALTDGFAQKDETPVQSVVPEANSFEEKTIEFTDSAYVPQQLEVRRGSKVQLHLVNKNGAGCVQAFTIPKLGIQKIVRPGSETNVEFIAPASPTEIAFMCSMGMYQGVIRVI